MKKKLSIKLLCIVSSLAKKLECIVANDVSADGSGFNTATNEVTIFSKNGDTEKIPLLSKYAVAHKILDRVARLIDSEI